VTLQGPSFSPALARLLRIDRALEQQLGALGAKAGLMIMHDQRGWSSPTFTGTCHRFTYEFRGPSAIDQGDNLLTFVAENEFTIPTQLVAEAKITDVVRSRVDEPKLRVELEMLLLDVA
jgi:hypothetical protein